jgi:DNA-binding NtrC family response regulator
MRRLPTTAILCVDDDPSVLDSLWIQLERNFGSDHLIESAESALEGLEVIDHLSEQGIGVLIIVSDWLMPGMSGGEFIKCVKVLYPDMRAIILSGQADSEKLDDLLRVGHVSSLVMKPWNETELVAAINDALK